MFSQCFPTLPSPELLVPEVRASGITIKWKQPKGVPVKRFGVSWKAHDWWTAEKCYVVNEHNEEQRFHISDLARQQPATVWVWAESHAASSPYSKPLEVVRPDDIFAAVFEGDVARCDVLLGQVDDPVAFLSQTDSHNVSLAHWAAWKGNADMVIWLGNNSAPFDIKGDDGMLPIHWVCIQNRNPASRPSEEDIAECVRLFLEQTGCGLDVCTAKGRTLLVLCVQSNLLQVAHGMIDSGADVRPQDEDGDSALHWAAYYGHADIVEKLCGKGCNALQQDNSGRTALHLAASQGHSPVVHYLANRFGRKLYQLKESNGHTALAIALDRGHDHVSELLSGMIASDLTNRLLLFYVRHNHAAMERIEEIVEYFTFHLEELDKDLRKTYNEDLDTIAVYHRDSWGKVENSVELFVWLFEAREATSVLKEWQEAKGTPKEFDLGAELKSRFGHDLDEVATWVQATFGDELHASISGPAPSQPQRADAVLVVDVEGMMCDKSCTPKVKAAIEAVPGVCDVVVSLEDKSAVVKGTASPDAVVRAVEGAGSFTAAIRPADPNTPREEPEGKQGQEEEQGQEEGDEKEGKGDEEGDDDGEVEEEVEPRAGAPKEGEMVMQGSKKAPAKKAQDKKKKEEEKEKAEAEAAAKEEGKADEKEEDEGDDEEDDDDEEEEEDEAAVTVVVDVEGMMCNKSCTPKVKAAVEAVPGVRDVVVSLEDKSATVSGPHVDVPAIVRAIEALGFKAAERDAKGVAA